MRTFLLFFLSIVSAAGVWADDSLRTEPERRTNQRNVDITPVSRSEKPPDPYQDLKSTPPFDVQKSSLPIPDAPRKSKSSGKSKKLRGGR